MVQSAAELNRLAVLACCLFWIVANAQASPFDCAKNCGVDQEGAYPHLIVGTVDGVATAERTAELFRSMKASKRWSALPADPDAFGRSARAVSIRLPSGRSYTVLITREEAITAPVKEGDFVRYSPHRGPYEKPPSDAADVVAYWNVTGCVAVLCRAGDSACEGGFRTGIYRASDGTALSPDGKRAVVGAPSIDPQSMRPR